MLMAIDVGNTNMVFGLLDGERLVGSFRLMTDANRTSDEIGLTVCEYFRRFDLTMDQVTDIIIASVVPQVMYALTQCHHQMLWEKAYHHRRRCFHRDSLSRR
ncbi:MAG: type III pantothenate kinase [Evtepia sp.]